MIGIRVVILLLHSSNTFGQNKRAHSHTCIIYKRVLLQTKKEIL